MSSFVTTTRHDTESTYAIDTFFHASNYSSPKQQSSDSHSKVVVTSSPTSQSNSMTYDCLPQQGTTSAVSNIPIENLSIQHSIANEWMSPLGYTEYNQPDMNFLFTYNELVIANKDMSPSTKLGSLSSTPPSPITKDSNQQTPVKPAEQYRRFSMMDMNNGRPDNETNYSFIPSQQKVVGSSPFIDFHHNQSLFQQQHMMSVNTSLQKERPSMRDVFAPQHPTVTNDDYLQQQQQQQQQQQHHHYQQQQEQTGVSWNQHGLLSRRPVCTAPIKEEDDVLNQDLTKYNYMVQSKNYCTPPSNFNQSMLSSSTSSPLKKHAKKRSIIEEVLHQDVSYSIPSVVPSVSEPIPTAPNWMQHHRKRTKSIRDNNTQQQEPVKSMSSSSTGSNNLDDVQHHHLMDEKYMINEVVPGSSCDNNNEFEMTNGDNQLLAAMPRRQKLRYEGDSYTPKWVRYTGHLKEGYCDSCNPGKWLQLKNSAYWYHKQFYHGISSVSGKSFMKPLEQRMGKGDMIEGLCHQCHRFVPACNGKKKNNYMLWYRHAHKCHLYDKPKSTLKAMRKLSITTSSIPK